MFNHCLIKTIFFNAGFKGIPIVSLIVILVLMVVLIYYINECINAARYVLNEPETPFYITQVCLIPFYDHYLFYILKLFIQYLKISI